MRASSRRILAGLFWLLASLGVLVSTVVVWSHQSLLTTEGWTRLVGDVFDDPEVISTASASIVQGVSDAIGLDTRIAGLMPGEGALLAGVITVQVESWLVDTLASVLVQEDVQQALRQVNAVAHETAIGVIRGGGDVVGSDAGTVQLHVFPLIQASLVTLMDAGLLDDATVIPDLSEYRPPAEVVAELETLLGTDLPDDIGTIELVSSERLAALQDSVRIFDLLTIGVVAITLVMIGLALWLSSRRLRMVAWLGVGAIAALALGRGVIGLVVDDLSGAVADSLGGSTVRAALEAVLDQFVIVSLVIVAIALVVAGIAMWLDRRSLAADIAAARRAVGSAAMGADAAARRLTAREWLRANQREVSLVGLGVIALLMLWRVGGAEAALLAAAATGLWLILVNAAAGHDVPDPMPEPASDPGAG